MGLIDRGTIVSVLVWSSLMAAFPGLMTRLYGEYFRDKYGVRKKFTVQHLHQANQELGYEENLMVTTHDGITHASLKFTVDSFIDGSRQDFFDALSPTEGKHPEFNVTLRCKNRYGDGKMIAMIDLGRHQFLRRSVHRQRRIVVPFTKEPSLCCLIVQAHEKATKFGIHLIVRFSVVPEVDWADPYPQAMRDAFFSVFDWFLDVMLIERRQPKE